MKRKRLFIIGIVTVVIAMLVAFIINILFKIHSIELFRAEWEAGDALNYVAAISGAIGTYTSKF